MKPQYNGMGEAEVVLAEPLGQYLRLWIVKHLADHPKPQQDPQYNHNTGNKISTAHFGPVQYLSHYSQIETSVVGKICNSYFPRVSLSKADAILTAANLNHLLGDEIPIIPNPNWSLKRWIDYMQTRGCY